MERSRPRCEGRHEHFWCRRLVSERRVGPDDRNCAGQLLQGRHCGAGKSHDNVRPERDQFPRVFAKVRIASFGDFAMGYENRVGLVLAKPLNEIVNVRRQAICNVNAALENSESQVGTGRLLQSISACVPRLDCMSSLQNRVGLVLAKPLNEIVNVRRQAIFNVNAALENSESQVGTGRLLQSISACVPRLDCMSSLPGRVLINSRLNVRCAPKSTEILSHRETWFPCRPRSGAFRVSAV